MIDWPKTWEDIEDAVFPHYQCDIWERGLYLYLISQTRLKGIEEETIPLSSISRALRCSDFQTRKVIRKLAEKGLVELDQSRQGHRVKPLLPSELVLPVRDDSDTPIKIEEIDFFSGRRFLNAILSRENGRCFYCLKEIAEDECELDHVVAQMNGGGNQYWNIVASCHGCNTKKQGNPAEDHIRALYRSSLISETELEERISVLARLQQKQLVPNVDENAL